jgi:hypothetical protein
LKISENGDFHDQTLDPNQRFIAKACQTTVAERHGPTVKNATESLSSQAVDPSCVSTGLPPPAFFAK